MRVMLRRWLGLEKDLAELPNRAELLAARADNAATLAKLVDLTERVTHALQSIAARQARRAARAATTTWEEPAEEGDPGLAEFDLSPEAFARDKARRGL